MSERWRKIPDWPHYASSLGRIRTGVRTLANGAEQGAHVLTPFEDADGYLRVTLTDGRRRKTFGVHQLVALAFHGPPEVLHGRGGKQDNTPGNLRYGSRLENEREKRSGSASAVRPRLRGLTEEETEEKIGRVVSPPLTAVSPVAGELA